MAEYRPGDVSRTGIAGAVGMSAVIRMEAPLVEEPGVIEIFCSGLAEVELIGDGCAEFTLFRYRKQHGAALDAPLTRYVVAKIIAPVAAIFPACELMLETATKAGVEAVWERLRRH